MTDRLILNAVSVSRQSLACAAFMSVILLKGYWRSFICLLGILDLLRWESFLVELEERLEVRVSAEEV